MTERRALVATRGPLTRPWQLSVPEGELRFLLIGWRVAPSLERESGLPASVASLLTRALSRIGALTYPASEPPSSERARVRQFKTLGIGERIRGLLSHVSQEFWLVTTLDPTVSSQLFDDPGFPWWLQGQIIVVSQSAIAPQFERASLLEFLDPTHPLNVAQLAAASAIAVVRPGVDGDVAALTSLNARTEEQIVEAIEAEAHESGFTWTLMPESAFADALTDKKGPTPQNSRPETDRQ